jgi:3-oxoacyl-[acyl-carrier protein] reductase
MNAKDFTENDGEMAKWVASETPAKRWAKAKEVADLTLFLASPESSYLTGAVIPIDGGWTIK